MRHAGDDADFAGAPTISGPLFGGPAPGPFDRSSEMERETDEIRIAEMLWRHQGRSNTVTLGEIAQVTAIDPRAVKATVQRLRNVHHCQIGSKHHGEAGYYWIVDEEDRRLAVGPWHSQILAMWDTLRVLDSRASCLKLLERMKEKLQTNA